MNSKDDKFSSAGAEASRHYDLPTNTNTNKTKSGDSDSVVMKRAAAKKLIERYYYQLTDGCGNPNCSNEFCASSGKVEPISPDQAAALALQLFRQKAKLCESNPPKIAKLPSLSSNLSEGEVTYSDTMKVLTSASVDSGFASVLPTNIPSTSGGVSLQDYMKKFGKSFDKATSEELFLTEKMVLDIISKCQLDNNYALLIRTLGQIYSRADWLSSSFLKDRNHVIKGDNLTKEDIRAMEEDQDKDQDSKEVAGKPTGIVLKQDEVTVDLDSVRRVYKALFAIKGLPFQAALLNALLILTENAEIDLKYQKPYENDPNFLNVFLIIMEIPALQLPEFVDLALPPICKAIAELPVTAQAKLSRIWAKLGYERLKELVEMLHQLITERVINRYMSPEYCLNDDNTIVAATKVMKILFYASMVGGKLDPPTLTVEENEPVDVADDLQDLLHDAIGRESKEPRQNKEDPLSQELNVRILDCRQPLVAFEDFYNEPLSDQIEMHKDIASFKDNKFSFMNYGFILTPASRSLGLYYDNRIRMYSEGRMSVLQRLVQGASTNPFLKVKVRRDHIIDDALVELEMVAIKNPNDLKKQLVVEFEGEQGIDEGGVSKEFFHLVVEEIFNPDFAMFTLNSETQNYWFNPTSFENDAQFTLIGIVLGLAIYNNVILDVHFPLVVYRKLLGKKGSFEDLSDWDPSLAHSLRQLLDYPDNDMEEIFGQTFRIGYTDVFGANLVYDLKENGDSIFVTQENKQEFVELYADFLLNKSIRKQFRAFHRGFQMVTEESPLKMLFRSEDVELLVCGNKNFDFNALEEATEYDNGYTSETAVIKNFWEIVHELSLAQKRKLLQFATGSDRAPVGGLSKLKLVISRNGPDSDRLPTAHTCFNVLLLPEYSTKEKLRERMLKAITYSKGFGML